MSCDFVIFQGPEPMKYHYVSVPAKLYSKIYRLLQASSAKSLPPVN